MRPQYEIKLISESCTQWIHGDFFQTADSDSAGQKSLCIAVFSTRWYCCLSLIHSGLQN